jgi:hypothetical protein
VRRESAPGLPAEFPARVANALAGTEYQEIMLLKVQLEIESARILSEAGRLGTGLVKVAYSLGERAGGVRQ